MPPCREKRSDVWLHFSSPSEGKVKCNLCHSSYSFSKNIGNLRKHLITKHPTLKLNATSIKKPNAGNSGMGSTPSEELSTAASNSQKTIETSTENVPNGPRQSSLQTYVSKPVTMNRQKNITHAILNMIVKDVQPFSLVNDEGFLELLKVLEPTYSPPSRNTFVNSLLEDKFQRCSEKLTQVLQQTQYVSVTTDSWTSKANEAYLAITAHFITDNWDMNSALLSCMKFAESRTSENLALEIKSHLEAWDLLPKTHVIITDNAANITKAVKILKKTHMPCVAHTLNLVVQQGLHSINDLRSKIKAIVEHFHRSPVANNKLMIAQSKLNDGKPQLKLKNDVCTRWNSTYFMFQRFVQLQDPLMATIGWLHNTIPHISEQEWKCAKEVVDILWVFDWLTVELSCEKSVSVSKLIILMKMLNTMLIDINSNLENDMSKKLLSDLQGNIAKRFTSIERNEIFSKASLLDPRFKANAFPDEISIHQAKKALQDETVALIHKTTQNASDIQLESAPQVSILQRYGERKNPWEYYMNKVKNVPTVYSPTAQAINEIRMYMEEPIIPLTDDPLKWWKSKNLIYPRLGMLAKKYLSIVATSVPSERAFSKAGQIVSERRSRLKANVVNKIMFLNSNDKLLN